MAAGTRHETRLAAPSRRTSCFFASARRRSSPRKAAGRWVGSVRARVSLRRKKGAVTLRTAPPWITPGKIGFSGCRQP